MSHIIQALNTIKKGVRVVDLQQSMLTSILLRHGSTPLPRLQQLLRNAKSVTI